MLLRDTLNDVVASGVARTKARAGVAMKDEALPPARLLVKFSENDWTGSVPCKCYPGT